MGRKKLESWTTYSIAATSSSTRKNLPPVSDAKGLEGGINLPIEGTVRGQWLRSETRRHC
jgi:hypothetical protein